VGQLVLWALLTGGITGGVWVSIVLLGNHARLRKEQQALGEDVAARHAELARLEARLAFIESRFQRLDGAVQRELEAPPER
jgi:t-SNARE complex subunit (syntaxin)